MNLNSLYINTFILLLILKISICDEKKEPKYIVTDIFTKYPEQGEKNYFYDDYINNYLFVKIKLGSDAQNLEMKFELNNYETYISSEKYINKSMYTPFNINTSSTFKTLKRFYSKNSEFTEAMLSNDSLIVNDGQKDVKLNNFYFAYLDKSYIEVPGSIGFNLLTSVVYPEESMNFIDQLKNGSIISGYSLTIKFDSNYKGQLIIGPDLEDILPYEVAKYTKHTVKAIYSSYGDGKWKWKFEKVLVGNSELLYSKESNFNLKYDFIIATDEYSEFIFKNFFSNLYGSNQCERVENKLFKYYYGVKCNKNINIKNFPDLTFKIASNFEKFNLILDYEDLFEEIGEYKYFKIILTNKPEETITINNDWTLGKEFFRKYLITFNKDRKDISIYVPEKQKKKDDPNSTENTNANLNGKDKSSIWLWILVVALFIMSGIIVYLLIKCIKQGKIIKNKNRLNILSDELNEEGIN